MQILKTEEAFLFRIYCVLYIIVRHRSHGLYIFSSLGDGPMTPALNAALNQAMNPASKNAVPSSAYSPVSMHLLRGCFHHLIQRQGAPHSAPASSDYHPRRKKIDKFVRSMSRERERDGRT